MNHSLFADLTALVGFNTQNPGGEETACVRWLEERLAESKPTDLKVVELPRSKAYVLASWGTPRLLINIHVDTVPAVKNWSSDPLVLERQGSRLVGLGTTDVKGAIAALLQALTTTTPHDCAILLSGDEEKDSLAIPHFLTHHAPATLQDAVVCEPTGGAVGVRHRGFCALEAVTTGVGGHSSQADHRSAPLAAMCMAAASLAAWGNSHRNKGPEGSKGLCLNISNLTGGVDYNIIPTEARLSFSMRPAPGEDGAALIAEAKRLIKEAAPDSETHDVLIQPPLATLRPADILARFGRKPDAGIDLPFWTEAALLASHGMNTAVWVPGDIKQAHSADEYIEEAALEEAVTVFRKLLQGDGTA